ncbi:exonuclease SbcC [Candidatus Nitrosopumilus sp. SW]|uniref:exonuclease SbcC n=1 Tax=Candidatus Nitrosopumilus sp. SW TaxID=2508726 RepID=UPI00114E801F|nr:exonuclease SbcC [Candidatus Nitrosopumilus sp. SW]QDI88251.1 exonuclease SbcC [Candidatus Nitrosopumilus sp. SW]
MVFGWGKKKQEEKPVEETPQTKSISLNDVERIVTDLEKLRESQTVSEINHLRNNTAPLIDDLIKVGKMLEKDTLNVDDIDKHLAIIVVRGKKQVINMIKKGVVSLPEVSSIDNAKKLDNSLNQILKKVGDVLGRQTRVIHIFAKKYATQLKDNLEVMNQNHSDIHDILQNYENTKSTSSEIIATLKKIDNLKSTKMEKTQKIIDTNNELESTKEHISSLEKSIEEIKSSDEYKKYLKSKKSLELFENEKSKIKDEINSQFTKISRPLGRYEYASSLDKDQKNILTKLVENPFDILIPQNKDSVILILENVRKGIVSGSISVKDVDKTLSQITETEETLDGFISQVSKYFEKYQQMSDELDSLRSEKLTSLESEFTKASENKGDLQLKSETFQAEVDEIDSDIPKLVSEIEKKLRLFSNTKYTVLMS